MAQYCDNFKFSENNQDHFVMVPVSNDTFQFWQGLRGPYFTPSVGDDGYLYWTNNGQLPNPEPVRIVGRDGRGITLTGQCTTVADLPEDPVQGEAWAVGEEEPFECYAWFGEWVDLGLLFPAGQDGVSPAVTITQTSTGHKVKITDKTHPAGQEFDVDNGTPGDPGQDGVSPAVTITPTSTGHKVKITDKTHPAGQEFDVDNGTPGAPGQGVPAGGAAGQFLRKTSAADYDAEWYSPAAGDISYDSSLTYASGTVGKELGDQKNTLTESIDYANSASPVSVSFSNKNVVKGVFNAQGQYQANSSYIVTKRIFDVSEFDFIEINIESGYSYNVAFYSSADESDFTELMSSTWITGNFSYIPADKYMRIQLRYNSGVASVSDISKVEIIGYNTKAAKNKIFTIFKEDIYKNDYLINTYNNYVQGYLSNGSLVYSTTYISSGEYIPVTDLQSIEVSINSGFKLHIICYDANKTFLFASPKITTNGIIDVSGVGYIKLQIGYNNGNEIRTGSGINVIATAIKKDSEIFNQVIGLQNVFIQASLVDGEVQWAYSRISTKEYIDISKLGLVGFTVENGYYFAVVFYTNTSASDRKYSSPWLYSNNEEIVFDVSEYSYMRVTLRRSDNDDITPDYGNRFTYVRGVIKTDCDQFGIGENLDTKITYEGERVSINPKLNFYNKLPASGFTTDYSFSTYFQQGAAIHNGVAYLFRHHGVCSAFNLVTMTLINEFVISSIVEDLPHCDNASFSRVYPNNNPNYPYCYVSRTSYPSETPDMSFNDRNACYVFDITPNGATLVQTIKYANEGSTLPFAYGSADWVVDAERNRLIAYHQGAAHGESYAPWIFKEFALPEIGESVVQLTESDILEEWRFDNVVWGHSFGVCQGLDVTGKYIFAPCSNPTINKEALVILDKYDHRMVACSEWDKDITDELQAAATYNGALYLVSEEARIDKIIFN